MKLPIAPDDKKHLCDHCVALCCRYFAFSIDKPKTQRDFEDLRWYMLHEDTILFVEDGQWYIQINRRCRELRPDNRCGIYEHRPAICRGYQAGGCDWHGDEYDYEHVFTEPGQIEGFAKQYLAEQRKRRAAGRRRANRKTTVKRRLRRSSARRLGVPLPLLKSA